jgi:hypothetical protein
MAFYTGTSGDLSIDGTVAAKVARWSYSGSMATLETTTLGDTDRTVTAGIRTHSGSATLFYYDENNVNSCSTLIRNLIKQRTGNDDGIAPESPELTLRLRINDGTANGKIITGEVLLTSVSMSMAVGEVLSAEVSFEFNGAPTEVTI